MPDPSESSEYAGGGASTAEQAVPLSRQRGALPQRTCVGCRVRASAATLVRVIARDGILIPDDRGRLPGRGAHVHPRLECLDTAAQRRAWTRALKLPAAPDDSLLRDRLNLS